MIRALTLLLIMFYLLPTEGQELKPYLSKMTAGETEDFAKGLNYYAHGDYQKAYESLANSNRGDIPYKKRFIANSIIYQRDNKIIKNNLDVVPETYKFFVEQTPMKIALKDSTSVRLDKNLFKAFLNDKDSITVMFDTGGSGVGINSELVEKYNMKSDTSISTSGSLPAFKVTFNKHPVVIPKIQIGEMVMTDIYAEYSVIDPNSEGTYDGPEFDIIIGLDTFIGYLEQVTFDWENGLLTFKKTASLKNGTPFLFYSSKPFTSFNTNGNDLTTIIDTGSSQDILPQEMYLDNYSKKEKKTYGDYTYIEYTVDFELNDNKPLSLKIGDYTKDLNLVIGNEKIDLLIGHKHRQLDFNLAKNIFNLR